MTQFLFMAGPQDQMSVLVMKQPNLSLQFSISDSSMCKRQSSATCFRYLSGNGGCLGISRGFVSQGNPVSSNQWRHANLNRTGAQATPCDTIVHVVVCRRLPVAPGLESATLTPLSWRTPMLQAAEASSAFSDYPHELTAAEHTCRLAVVLRAKNLP